MRKVTETGSGDKDDEKLIKELREAGLRGTIHLEPVKVDLDVVGFDDEHINGARGRNISLDEAKEFIRNASISETVWDGKFERYYGHEGVAYLNNDNMQIRTAFRSDNFRPTVKRVIEVLTKYGR